MGFSFTSVITIWMMVGAMLPHQRGSFTKEDATLEARVDALIQPYVDIGMFSGAVLIARGDSILVSKGYGMANHEFCVPHTPETKFRVASISKQFTALAIGRLIAKNRLSFETRLSDILPDFPNGEKMTILQLLEHKAGLDRLNNHAEYHQRMKLRHNLADLVSWIGELPLLYPPGESRKYSSGYLVLAYVIEKLSNRPFPEFLRQEVLIPLGLVNTGHESIDGVYHRLATGYVPGTEVGEVRKATYVAQDIKMGGGSLYSTTGDLYKFARSWHQHSLFSREMWQELVGPQERNGKKLTLYLQGRAPGYFAYLGKDQKQDVIAVVLSNNYAWVPWAKRLLDLANGEQLSLPNYRFRHKKPDAGTLKKARGRYTNSNTDVLQIFSKDKQLFYRNPERGTEILMPMLENDQFLLPIFDLMCHFDEKGVMVCTSHWHDETITYSKTTK